MASDQLYQQGISPVSLLKMAAKYKLRVVGAAQVVAVCCKGETVLAGARMKDIVVYEVSTLLTRGLCVSANDYLLSSPAWCRRTGGGL